MAMMRKMHDSEWWKCVLQFRGDSPCDTAMVPFLSASRNPDLQSIPSLAENLRLVETAVSGRAMLSSSFAAVAKTSDDCHGSYFHDKHWKHILKRRLPPLFYGSLPEEEGLSEHIDNGRGAESPDGVPRSLPLDIWQKWGSDLELAGPRTSETSDLAIPRGSISDANLSLYTAPTSPSSPFSSSFSSQNGDSAFWVPSALVESSPAMSDTPIETPRTNGNDFFPGEAEIFIAKSPIFVVDKEAHVDSSPLESPSRCSMTNLQRKSIAPETCESDLVPHAKRTTSMCSETGVGFAEVDGWNCPSKLSKRWVGMAESTETAALSKAFNNGRGKGFRAESGGEGLRVGKKRIKSEGWRYSRGSAERLTEISMTDLSHYFNMPISQACKELKVGLTVLKRRCREFGIPRWPHRKMKSLESLICNIQDLSKDDGGNHTDHVLHAVKELEEQRKAMEEKPGTELAERTKRLRQACFKASYKKRRKQQEAHYTSPDSEAAVYHSMMKPIFTDSYKMLCPSSLICE